MSSRLVCQTLNLGQAYVLQLPGSNVRLKVCATHPAQEVLADGDGEVARPALAMHCEKEAQVNGTCFNLASKLQLL
jgi:hypothetical protein